MSKDFFFFYGAICNGPKLETTWQLEDACINYVTYIILAFWETNQQNPFLPLLDVEPIRK